jgi:hypothetical protein
VTLTFGNTPVPYTVSWTDEQANFVGFCPWAGRDALCMPHVQGRGRPHFGTPHACRQRETIQLGRCDLCGKTLENRTKVSLSHAKPRAIGGGLEIGILQVEPLLHKECAAISMRHCPSLRRDIKNGTLMVRQMLRSRGDVAGVHLDICAFLCRQADRPDHRSRQG